MGLDEAEVAETLGVLTRETTSEDERKGRSGQTRRGDRRLRRLSLPCVSVDAFLSRDQKEIAEHQLVWCLDNEDDGLYSFFAGDDFDETTRRVVTAEDVVFFLGIENVLSRAFDPACYDEKHLFDSCKSTYIVARAEHASGCSVASCFGWLFDVAPTRASSSRAHVDARRGIESRHRERDLHSRRRQFDAQIFPTHLRNHEKPKSAGACTRAFVGSHDGGVDDARGTICGKSRIDFRVGFTCTSTVAFKRRP